MSVMVVVTSAEGAAPLVRWGGRFARSRGETLEVLYVARGTKPAPAVDLPLVDLTDEHPVRAVLRDAALETSAMLLFDEEDPLSAEARSAAQRARAKDEQSRREESRALVKDVTQAALARRRAESERLEAEQAAQSAAGGGAPTEAEAEAATAEAEPQAERSETRASDRLKPVDVAEDVAEDVERVLGGPVPDRLGDAAAGFVSLRGLAHPDVLAATLREVAERKPSLVVVGRNEKLSSSGLDTDLGRTLMEHAACDVLLLRAVGVSGQRCARVLVPSAGGPHSMVSLRLAEGLTADGSVVEPLYVEPEVGGEDPAESLAVGEQQLTEVLKQARVDARIEQIKPRVELGNDPTKVIGACAREGYDLVLVGASNQNFATRLLFGTVPEQLLAGEDSVAMAVMRRGTVLRERAAIAIGSLFARHLPQLGRDDRIDLFQRLQSGSRFNVDFLTLIASSTAIASLGLIQNSPAVVIGAMLVAPLMTPMIGSGLALVQGNWVLLREATRAIASGFLTALLIGWLVGMLFSFVMPPGTLTPELLNRGGPTLLDLFVAFASGIAAAYAIARPNLSGALPGVAIAAALVPPIGTVGISIAHGQYANGAGAALLFGTNLVAIVLGSALTFRLIGVQGNRAVEGRLWVRRLLVVLFVCLLALAVPLVSSLINVVTRGRTVVRVTPELQRSIEGHVENQGLNFVALSRSHTALNTLEVVVAAPPEREPHADLPNDLVKVAEKVLGREVRVRLITIAQATRQDSD